MESGPFFLDIMKKIGLIAGLQAGRSLKGVKG
jgi:hypothetical protein